MFAALRNSRNERYGMQLIGMNLYLAEPGAVLSPLFLLDGPVGTRQTTAFKEGVVTPDLRILNC